jgi:hypothetical protein
MYFFHLEDGECIRDPNGEEFASDDAAMIEAAKVAHDLSTLVAHDLSTLRVYAHEWHVVVKNAVGLRIGSVQLLPELADEPGALGPTTPLH